MKTMSGQQWGQSPPWRETWRPQDKHASGNNTAPAVRLAFSAHWRKCCMIVPVQTRTQTPMRSIIDKKQVAANRARAKRLAVDGADFLLRRALDELIERLAVTKRDFAHAVALGPFADRIAGVLDNMQSVASTSTADFDDAEVLDVPPAQFDLAVSLLHLHELNDVPGALVQIRNALRPDGLFLACMPASGTLAELRTSLMQAEAEAVGGVHPRVLPFVDVRDAGALLQRAGFALPVTDTDDVVVRYATALALMRDLRAMAATNTLVDRIRRPSTRTIFLEAARHYGQHFADADGRVRASFSFVWMSGWVPDASQPKPLAPGSARHSLADALNDKSRR